MGWQPPDKEAVPFKSSPPAYTTGYSQILMIEQPSPFSESTKFWEAVMQETKKRWPTQEEFEQGSVRELIDCCFVVHQRIMESKET